MKTVYGRMRLASVLLAALLAALPVAASDAPPVETGPMRTPDLVELTADAPGIMLDMRYATADNFVGEPVYPEGRAFLQRPAAEALGRVRDALAAKGYGLLILDAYRPWHVTKLFWDRYPQHRAYLADPASGSRHNRGCAVDLTLFDLGTGREVAMPSGFDDFTERAHPAYTGGTEAERTARDLLISAMGAEGFAVYENEWWHFDYRDWRRYPIMDTPFSDIR